MSTTKSSMSLEEILAQHVTADIMKQYGGKVEKPKDETPKEPEKLFLSTKLPTVKIAADAIMYSTLFEGAPDYLKDHGLDDLDVTSLVHKPEDFSLDAQSQIPVFDTSYVWQHDVLYPFILATIHGLKVLTVGDTGTGKTTFHKNLAAKFNQPFYRLGGRGDMESDSIIGRVTFTEGETKFLVGEFPKALVAGYYILLDEIWKLPPGINMVLQRVLERDGLLQIDDMEGDIKDKQFYPHKSTRIMLADNVVGTGDAMDQFAATQLQDSSTLNRVDMVLRINYLPKDMEVAMLTSRYPHIPKKQASRMVSMAAAIRDAYKNGQIQVTISPRNLMSWCEMATALGASGTNPKCYAQAFTAVMLNRYADDNERNAVKGFWQTVYGETL